MWSTLAYFVWEAGRTAEAIAQYEQLVVDRGRILGLDDRETLQSRYSLASRLRKAGRMDEALVQFEQLVVDRTRVLGPNDPETLQTRQELDFYFGNSLRNEGNTRDDS